MCTMNRLRQFLFKPGWNVIFVVLGVLGVSITAALDPMFRLHRCISMVGTIGLVTLAQLLLLTKKKKSAPKEEKQESTPWLRTGFWLVALPGIAYFPVTTILIANGRNTQLMDVVVLCVIILAGLRLRPNVRFLVWTALCVSLVVSPVLIRFLPKSPALAGIEEPSQGADLEIAWHIDGMTAALAPPLDPPLLYINDRVIRRTVEQRWEEANPVRIEASCAACGEEKAAKEALESGDQDRALARARLALQIDPQAGFARAVAAGTLLRRGIYRMRTGEHGEAEQDLVEALGFLVQPDDRARAYLALGKTLLSMKRKDEAFEAFRSATKEAPEHPAGKMAAMEPGRAGKP